MSKKAPSIPMILEVLLGQGCKFRAQYGTLYMTPGKVNPPTDGQKELVRISKERIIAYLEGGHLERVWCVPCGRWLDERGRCWRCCDRRCQCGRRTGSAFIEQCCACGNKE